VIELREIWEMSDLPADVQKAAEKSTASKEVSK
jgi:hypothetical protein